MPISGPKKNKNFTRSIDRGRIEEAVVESRISINAKKKKSNFYFGVAHKRGQDPKTKGTQTAVKIGLYF